MSRKPVNPRPWHCIACGAELPPERQQGRCLECLIGKRDEMDAVDENLLTEAPHPDTWRHLPVSRWTDHTTVLGSIVPGPRHDPVVPDYSFLDSVEPGKRP